MFTYNIIIIIIIEIIWNVYKKQMLALRIVVEAEQLYYSHK